MKPKEHFAASITAITIYFCLLLVSMYFALNPKTSEPPNCTKLQKELTQTKLEKGRLYLALMYANDPNRKQEYDSLIVEIGMDN